MANLKTGKMEIVSVKRVNVPMCEWVNNLGEVFQSEVLSRFVAKHDEYTVVWCPRSDQPRVLWNATCVRRFYTADIDVPQRPLKPKKKPSYL